MRITLLLATLATAAHAQHLVVKPYDPTGIYGLNKTIGWTIKVAEGEQASAGTYSYVVKENGARAIKSGTMDLTKGVATIETSLAAPGMVRVEIRPPAGAAHARPTRTSVTCQERGTITASFVTKQRVTGPQSVG